MSSYISNGELHKQINYSEFKKEFPTLPQVKELPRDAHWQWFADGWKSFKQSYISSIKVSSVLVLVSLLSVFTLHETGLGSLIPIFMGIYMIIAPMYAARIYRLSSYSEKTTNIVNFKDNPIRAKSPSQIAFIGFVLSLFSLAFIQLSMTIYGITLGRSTIVSEEDFLKFISSNINGEIMALGVMALGAFISAIVFSISLLSIPMVYDKKIDAISAMAFSAKTVLKNPVPMFSLAFSIVLLMGISAFFLFIPLLAVFPFLAHTSWKAYKASI